MNKLAILLTVGLLVLAGKAAVTEPLPAPATVTQSTPKPKAKAKPVRTWTPATSRSYVRRHAAMRGWTGREWRCLDELIHAESRWNHKADNPDSTAFGLFQQLKLNPKAGVEKQTRLGLKYVSSRYASPCNAREHQVRNGWY